MSEPTFRQATENDAPGVAAIGAQVWDELGERSGFTQRPALDGLLELMSRERAAVFVCESDGMRGFALVSPDPDDTEEAVMGVWLLPRGAGQGSRPRAGADGHRPRAGVRLQTPPRPDPEGQRAGAQLLQRDRLAGPDGRPRDGVRAAAVGGYAPRSCDKGTEARGRRAWEAKPVKARVCSPRKLQCIGRGENIRLMESRVRGSGLQPNATNKRLSDEDLDTEFRRVVEVLGKSPSRNEFAGGGKPQPNTLRKPVRAVGQRHKPLPRRATRKCSAFGSECPGSADCARNPAASVTSSARVPRTCYTSAKTNLRSAFEFPRTQARTYQRARSRVPIRDGCT